MTNPYSAGTTRGAEEMRVKMMRDIRDYIEKLEAENARLRAEKWTPICDRNHPACLRCIEHRMGACEGGHPFESGLCRAFDTGALTERGLDS